MSLRERSKRRVVGRVVDGATDVLDVFYDRVHNPELAFTLASDGYIQRQNGAWVPTPRGRRLVMHVSHDTMLSELFVKLKELGIQEIGTNGGDRAWGVNRFGVRVDVSSSDGPIETLNRILRRLDESMEGE